MLDEVPLLHADQLRQRAAVEVRHGVQQDPADARTRAEQHGNELANRRLPDAPASPPRPEIEVHRGLIREAEHRQGGPLPRKVRCQNVHASGLDLRDQPERLWW